MKLFFLINPSRAKKQWDYREMASRAARRYGWTARFGQIERGQPQSTDHLRRQALEEECSRLVVIGGDGTLHAALNSLYQLKKLGSLSIGVVPGGTCNDFARALGLFPRRLEDALAVACTGEPRETDLGK